MWPNIVRQKRSMWCIAHFMVDYSTWIRPLAMFIETVQIDGQQVPRFAFVEAAVEQRV